MKKLLQKRIINMHPLTKLKEKLCSQVLDFPLAHPMQTKNTIMLDLNIFVKTKGAIYFSSQWTQPLWIKKTINLVGTVCLWINAQMWYWWWIKMVGGIWRGWGSGSSVPYSPFTEMSLCWYKSSFLFCIFKDFNFDKVHNFHISCKSKFLFN